jgi:predicted ATP-dependent serine protease
LEPLRVSVLEQPLVEVVDDEPLLRERVLETAIAPIDRLIGGLRSGEVTLFESDNSYSSSLLHLLCVKAVAEFDEEVVWIDGGNAVDPYAMSSLCKRLRLDKREVLSRINISRAFTAYQLVSLIDERLREQVGKCAPAMVIVSSATDLFLDKDMKWTESYQLLRRCADAISSVTESSESITVVTAYTPGHVIPDQKMTSALCEISDKVIQISTKRSGLVFRMPKDGRQMLFTPTPWNQTTLDEFRGDEHGTHGAYIPLGP